MALATITGEFGLVTDPELKFSNAGKAWVKFRGVTKERVRSAEGTWTDGRTTFIDVVAFGKEAENLVESASKGDTVMVSGKLEQREWTDDDGAKRTSYRIVADEIGMSLKWGPARTGKMATSIDSIKESLGAEELTAAPF